MEFSNKYSSWYDKYRAKPEKPNRKQNPYRIKKIENDQGVPVNGMENAIVYHFTPGQARYVFMERYPKLKEYADMGWQFEVVLARDVIEEDQRQREQIAEIERQRKQDEDEFVQDAWWND